MNTNHSFPHTGYYNPEDDYGYAGNSYGNIITPKDYWAGSSPERAYSEETSWPFRRQGQIKFNSMLERSRRAFHKSIGLERNQNDRQKADPQISAFFTSFPWPACAAVGHTMFVEAGGLRKGYEAKIKEHLVSGEKARASGVNEKAYIVTAGLTAQSLANRALFDMFGGIRQLGDIEFYRLFQTAQNSLKFRKLNDVLDGVVLLGDLLPTPRLLKLHPMTAQIMHRLTRASKCFWRETLQNTPQDSLEIYTRWGDALMDALLQFLPPAESKKDTTPPRDDALEEDEAYAPPQYRYSSEEPLDEKPPEAIPPLLDPLPPQLDLPRTNPKNPIDYFIDAIKDKLKGKAPLKQDGDGPPDKSPFEETKKTLDDFTKTITEAGSQTHTCEDLREDLVETILDGMPFDKGPISGTMATGNDITCEIGGKEVGGEVFDRTVPLCDDIENAETLRREAAPVTQVLRKNLYPSMHEEIVMEYPRRSGQMDARRLPMAEFSDTLYRRFRAREALDPSGRALLLIAADASASLSDSQMRMCKYLMSAWLDSITSGKMQVAAAFYHSGAIRAGLTGPLVQWVYHPGKTPVYTPREALRAVASLPNSGSGAQSDALSLIYLFDEAKKLSCGATVYLTLITDCAFNKSFAGAQGKGVDEVVEVLTKRRAEFEEKLHITLVSLGKSAPNQISEAVDSVISVDETALKDPVMVAKGIGSYVAACIRGRREKTQAIR